MWFFIFTKKHFQYTLLTNTMGEQVHVHFQHDESETLMRTNDWNYLSTSVRLNSDEKPSILLKFSKNNWNMPWCIHKNSHTVNPDHSTDFSYTKFCMAYLPNVRSRICLQNGSTGEFTNLFNRFNIQQLLENYRMDLMLEA